MLHSKTLLDILYKLIKFRYLFFFNYLRPGDWSHIGSWADKSIILCRTSRNFYWIQLWKLYLWNVVVFNRSYWRFTKSRNNQWMRSGQQMSCWMFFVRSIVVIFQYQLAVSIYLWQLNSNKVFHVYFDNSAGLTNCRPYHLAQADLKGRPSDKDVNIHGMKIVYL